MSIESSRILVPIGFSDQSMIALGQAFNLAKIKKSKIILKFDKYYKSFSEFYAETLNYWVNKQYKSENLSVSTKYGKKLTIEN